MRLRVVHFVSCLVAPAKTRRVSRYIAHFVCQWTTYIVAPSTVLSKQGTDCHQEESGSVSFELARDTYGARGVAVRVGTRVYVSPS